MNVHALDAIQSGGSFGVVHFVRAQKRVDRVSPRTNRPSSNHGEQLPKVLGQVWVFFDQFRQLCRAQWLQLALRKLREDSGAELLQALDHGDAHLCICDDRSIQSRLVVHLMAFKFAYEVIRTLLTAMASAPSG